MVLDAVLAAGELLSNLKISGEAFGETAECRASCFAWYVRGAGAYTSW
jgi:hypothetical protein